MLLKVNKDLPNAKKGEPLTNMVISTFPEMCLFTTNILQQKHDCDMLAHLEITYRNPQDDSQRTLEVPLLPDPRTLAPLSVLLNQSPTKAYEMPELYSAWFSKCFGFDVVFAYIGDSTRLVYGNVAPNAAIRNPQMKKKQTASWLSALASSVPSMLLSSDGKEQHEDFKIAFSDCSPYLVVSRTSLENVSARLPDGIEMDITKFRPNIIVSGSREAFEEDFWAELELSGECKTNLQLTSNCVRCASVTVDYETGEFGKGPASQVLKKMQSDRRVDQGVNYRPVFGRYGFLKKRLGNDLSEDATIVNVGDQVQVTKRNEKRTSLLWPGFGSTPKDDLYPVSVH